MQQTHESLGLGTGQNDRRYQTDFCREELAIRRARILETLGPDEGALIQGAPVNRFFDLFYQSSDFYYLCGLETPQARLLLLGDGSKAILFVPQRQRPRSGVGDLLLADDAELICALTGVDAVYAPEEMERFLRPLKSLALLSAPSASVRSTSWALRYADKVQREDEWDGLLSREERLMNRLKERFPAMAFRDLTPLLLEMRRVKSPAELTLMRRAGYLSGLAAAECMKAARPGMNECALHALTAFLFHAHGATGEEYRAIIPNGPTVWDSHYILNSDPLVDGNLALFDAAPNVNYYTSDIGRMFPVNGTYAPWQRALYGFVVDLHKVLLSRIRPGIPARQVVDEAGEIMRPEVDRYPFASEDQKTAAIALLEFQGSLSHAVGMDVHDPSLYKEKPLEPGVVFSVDPQLWVKSEQLYIRIEDTVVVTEDGVENLTGYAPIDLDDCEALMREESGFAGLLERYHP